MVEPVCADHSIRAAKGTGFEPSVPREAAGILVISVLVRADFSACRESSKWHEPASKTWACHAGPMVRIRLPPPGSPVRTRFGRRQVLPMRLFNRCLREGERQKIPHNGPQMVDRHEHVAGQPRLGITDEQ